MILRSGRSRSEQPVSMSLHTVRRGFDIPLAGARADEHQGEFLPHRAERVAWLTGFTGSAAVAAVLPERAAILTDGRYTIQVARQVDTAAWEVRHVNREPLAEWIGEHLRPGSRFGYDPWLHSIDSARAIEAAVEKAGGTPVALDANPIDLLWEDRPAAPLSPAVPHHERHAGQSSAGKREAIADILAADGHDAVVLSSPESVAWLLNIRGRDVPRTPLCLSFAILDRAGTVDLFVDRRKITGETRSHLGNAVSIHPPEGLAAALADRAARGNRLRLDPASSPAWVANHVTASGGTVATGPDPGCPAAGAQEPGRTRGRALGAPSRRGGLRPVPVLVCRRGARGPARRAGRGGPAAGIPRRAGAFCGSQFRHDFRGGAERGHRPLPGDAADQPDHSPGRPVPGGFGRAVPRRNHRHHPHHRGRRSRPRGARTVHPGAEGPYRPGHHAVPGGHHRRPARRRGPGSAVAGGDRLRSRHRARRRILSRRPRGTAVDFRAIPAPSRSSPA